MFLRHLRIITRWNLGLSWLYFATSEQILAFGESFAVLATTSKVLSFWATLGTIQVLTSHQTHYQKPKERKLQFMRISWMFLNLTVLSLNTEPVMQMIYVRLEITNGRKRGIEHFWVEGFWIKVVFSIHVKMFVIFVEYSREKNMVDVIFFGSAVGLHRISNEVRRNKFSALATLLLTSWRELNILSNCFFPFFNLNKRPRGLNADVFLKLLCSDHHWSLCKE